MPRTKLLLVTTLLAAVSLLDGRAAQPTPPDKTASQFDRDGDPVPTGAIFRFGSDRLSHQGWVFCTAFSPNGTTLASGGGYNDATVRLWEPATGKEILQLRHGGPVRDLVWSKDGKLLVTASDGGGIQFWDVATGKQVRNLPKVGSVVRLALSGDGKTLALGEYDFGGSSERNRLCLRDAATGKELHGFAVERAYNVVFSPDGQTVALGGEKKIRLWEVAAGKELPSLEGHGKGTYAVIFSPNGKLLASGGTQGDYSALLLDLATGRVVHRFGPFDYGVHCIRFSSDGKTMAIGSGNPAGIITLWDVASGKEIRQLKGHRSPIDSFSFSADGKMIASSGSWERTVRLWDVADGKERSTFARHQGEVECVALAPDGRSLATASSDHNVFLWTTATGEKVGALLGHKGKVITVAYSPDGQLLATGGHDKTIRIWEANSGKERQQFSVPSREVKCVVFSPDGRSLASAESTNENWGPSGARMPDCAARLWDLATGKAIHHLEAKTGRVDSVAFSPDGRILASAGPDADMIHLWNPATGTELGKLQSEPERATPPSMAEGITRVVFSPDGKTLASVSRYRYPSNIRANDDKKMREVRMVRLWEIATGKERAQIRLPFHMSDRIPDGRRNEITCAAFSADGQVLILGKKDGDIAFWHIPAGKEIRLTRAHKDFVTAVVLAPDGKTFASASEDTTALLWNAEALHAPWQARLTEKERDSHWADLASADAARAYHGVWALAGAPRVTLPFLKERLQPIPIIEAGKVARMIEDLDDRRFAVRDKASGDLDSLADSVLLELRTALAKSASLETRRRIEGILAKHGGRVPPPDYLRALRAVEVLEQIGTPDSRQILQSLAAGAPEATLTREARTVLKRLAQRLPAR